MEYIDSKNTYLLIKDVLRLMDAKIADHNSRVSYLVYRMLEAKGGYEEFELADIVLLASLHDIGAYYTDRNKHKGKDRYGTKEFMPHSIFGYLFFKYLSPHPEWARIILHHHMDYVQLPPMEEQEKQITDYIHIADYMDTYQTVYGKGFDYGRFRAVAGTRFSEEGIRIFDQIVEQHDVLQKIKTDAYRTELNEILEYLIFSNEEKQKYMQMITYCMGLYAESYITDTVICSTICRELGERFMLDEAEQEILYAGTLLRDIAMPVLWAEVGEGKKTLTEAQKRKLQSHVLLAEEILRDKVHPYIKDLVSMHHERGNATGYPRRVRFDKMNKLQLILQVSDFITQCLKETMGQSSRKAIIIQRLWEEVDKKALNKQNVDTFVSCYNEIMEKARLASMAAVAPYHIAIQKYEKVHQKMPAKT